MDEYYEIPKQFCNKISELNLNGTQFKIVLNVIINNDKSVNGRELSEKLLGEVCKCDKRQVHRELHRLFDRGILKEIEPPTYTTARVIGLNENINEWRNK